MSSKHTIPTDIVLHKKSRVLELTFDDGEHFQLPCEYLRVFSPSAEVRGHGPGEAVLQLNKESVNIDQIDPVGNYAVILHFDDGHSTGIYSWEYLYDLGTHFESYWQGYLENLEAAGYTRKPDAAN